MKYLDEAGIEAGSFWSQFDRADHLATPDQTQIKLQLGLQYSVMHLLGLMTIKGAPQI